MKRLIVVVLLLSSTLLGGLLWREEGANAQATDGTRTLSKATRGITGVSKGPRDLSVPQSVPPGQEGVYQLGVPFQLSATQAGIFCNIRRAAVYANDLEIGSDLVIFDDAKAISSSSAVPLIRGEEMDHPETGERMILSTYPLFGGFVPRGAKLDDGSPHPHAGTGFALCTQWGYPVDAKSTFWTLKKTFSQTMMQQYEYDGRTFRILTSGVVDRDRLVPGHVFSTMGLRNAIPDGTDLLTAISTQPSEDDGGELTTRGQSGLARWRRGPAGRWSVVDYRPVPGAEGACEPTLVRDVDGSLLLSTRGTWDTGNNQSLMVWGSFDGGDTWEKLIHERGIRNSAPVSLNRSADGTPYLAANPHYLPSGCVVQHREVLALWPLAPDRRSLLDPIVVRDGSADFGLGPRSHGWWVDHPSGYTVRLADGELRHLLVYRVLGNHEAIYNARPAPQTGCYVEEVYSVNKPLPIWKF